MITVKIEGNNLILTLPFNPKGRSSKSGKSLVHASTDGNVATTTEVNGKPLVIGVNAYTLNR
jgi:hypothetical protein